MIILKYNDNFSESKFRRAGNAKKGTFCCSFMEWQQKKGEEYQPNSLRTIQNLFQSVSQ